MAPTGGPWLAVRERREGRGEWRVGLGEGAGPVGWAARKGKEREKGRRVGLGRPEVLKKKDVTIVFES